MGYALLLTASLMGTQSDIVGDKVKLVSGKVSVQALEFTSRGAGPFPAVILVHGDFGMTPWVRRQASRLANQGYRILAVDLYDGELPKTVEEAHILERGLDENKVQAQLKAALDYLALRPGVRQDAIGILGWDMGGGHALEAAIHDGRLKAAVVCYGRLPTDARTLTTLKAPVLGLFAGKDEGIPKTTIDQFQKAVDRAGKKATIHVYADAESGFMDPDCPYLSARPAAALIADAWGRIEKFLAAELTH